MKITRIETIRADEWPNLLWIRLYTDTGIVGLGEAYKGVKAVEAYLHETVAPYLLGVDPRDIERIDLDLRRFQFSLAGVGVETRGNSAINIALWDIYGRATGQPLYQLLGGRCREAIRIYNTCAGPLYQRRQPRQTVSNFGIPAKTPSQPAHEDLHAFLNDPAGLAEELLADGCTAMKIWPFDEYAEASDGRFISRQDMEKALEPFKLIRERVGQKMDIMVEMHSLWDVPTAIEIGRALEPYSLYWFEDPIRMNDLDGLKEFYRAVPRRIAASELLAGTAGFRELLERRIAGVVMLDIGWCGGLTEARKIAAMAEAYSLPLAPHDCTGPVLWAVSVHLSLHAANALIQECVRAAWDGWYRELVSNLPSVRNGRVSVNDVPGHGCELRPELLARTDLHLSSSE